MWRMVVVGLSGALSDLVGCGFFHLWRCSDPYSSGWTICGTFDWLGTGVWVMRGPRGCDRSVSLEAAG